MAWVLAVVQVLYVILCILLIIVILLQAGKGGGMGVAFGGAASQSMFTSSGAGNFLTRLTSILAIFFMLFSLVLSWSSSKTGSERLKTASKTVPTVNQILDETLGVTSNNASAPATTPTGDATAQPAPATTPTGDATAQPAPATTPTGDATAQPAPATTPTGDATAQPAPASSEMAPPNMQP